jgi:O-antigen biosynthesis protein WbqP
VKRALDLLIALPAGLVALPIVVILSILIVVTSGWPPLVIQERVGADERPIRVPKLRTMKRGVPVVAKALLHRRDVYTRLGPLLRRTSLDELPQVWSVLRGDMSLVGPRPALPSQHDLLVLRRRYGITRLKPGITGLAQVLGREDLTLSTKVRSEALYARRLSVRLDLLLLLWTVRAVLFGRGAF